jgi:hypothetical protein
VPFKTPPLVNRHLQGRDAIFSFRPFLCVEADYDCLTVRPDARKFEGFVYQAMTEHLKITNSIREKLRQAVREHANAVGAERAELSLIRR